MYKSKLLSGRYEQISDYAETISKDVLKKGGSGRVTGGPPVGQKGRLPGTADGSGLKGNGRLGLSGWLRSEDGRRGGLRSARPERATVGLTGLIGLGGETMEAGRRKSPEVGGRGFTAEGRTGHGGQGQPKGAAVASERNLDP
jgi:hypothetical protein